MPNALQGLLGPAEMRETPRKNKLMGLLADALTQANTFATKMDPRYENKRENQTLGLLADAVSLGSLAKTAERISYGEPLTNAGKANMPLLKPETADALMMAPLSPRNALAAMGMVGGMADNGAMRAATVWHGSPHKFDKFDASKIGTGEGAQAYGHGLYLAESPHVAKGYADILGQGWTVDGSPVDGQLEHAATIVKQYGADGARNYVRGMLDSKDFSGRPLVTQQWVSDQLKAIDSIAGKRVAFENTGSLYKVDLPDDRIAKMLDWESGGQAAWEQAVKKHGSERAAAEALRKAGIPGIRYLDSNSRAAGKGTSNFVVFPGEDSALTILERNGSPLR